MQLAGRHVLITGAGKRVARRIAEVLLAPEHGDAVKLSAHYFRSADAVKELVTWGKTHGREVHAITADLRDVGQLRAAARDAVQRFGPVDVLVNSASDFFPTPALEATEEDWDRLLDVNLKGQFFLAQAVAERMREKGGVIVNIADVNGERAMRNYAPYTASKGGLLTLTRSLAKEWGPKIRVNAVSPGPVLLPESYTEAQRQRSIDRTLLKRLGSPDDIAQACLFLIENDYVTGFDLKVDGGRSLA